MKRFFAGALAALVVLSAAHARADVKLAKIFSSNMVLQQKTQAPVWGWAEAGEAVKVTLGDKSAETKAGDDGKWSVKIETPAGSNDPVQLKINGKNEIVLENVLIGEVWLCSGQSNMQWGVNSSTNAAEEIKNANHPTIRLFTVPSAKEMPATEPQADLALDLKWSECKSETIPGFSAVGYFFGRKLNEELKVPVGLINSSWGGTICEAWTSKGALEADKEWLAPIVERHTSFQPGNPNQPAVLYNGMIHPLVPFAIRGAIWYQGESNKGRAEQYATLFPAMIKDWRSKWNQGDFPFLFVQLAPYAYSRDAEKKPVDSKELAELWEAQFKTLSLPNTGMAVTTDVTEINDIHPKNKQDVGLRLALWALGTTYEKKELVYSGPLYDSMTVEDGKIRIKFKHVGGGLEAKDSQPLNSFTIAGEDEKFVEAKAEIDGDSIVVSSPDVAKPVAVRFGWNDLAEPNFVNKAGLPASPFRTDKFKLVTAGRK
jgi:sialate O-acetylesterase